jgi:hypothetical protein
VDREVTGMTLAARITSNASNVIANISTDRFENFTEQWGGYSNETVGAPNWGLIVQSVVQVYPDFLGQMAWLVLFLIPFMMMWVAFSDIIPVAIVGIFFGLYVFAYIGTQYQGLAVLFIGISVAGVLWGLWQK